MWLYQMSQAEWPEAQFRLEIWEGGSVYWPTRRVVGKSRPQPGDRMVCWYAQTGAALPGLVGWGLVLAYMPDREEICWRPVVPSDELKMAPLFDNDLAIWVDKVRGRFKQSTMWQMSEDAADFISERIVSRGIFKDREF